MTIRLAIAGAGLLANVLCAALPVSAQPQQRPATTTTIANAESSAPVATGALQGRALVAALKRGGYVIYFRHAATDYARDDSRMKGYDDCDNQRLLSAQGQREATETGQKIRALGLPTDEKLASPFCRTMDHARRMLLDATPRVEVRESAGGDYEGLKRLLAAPVKAGTNRWIVGHGTPFRAVAGPPHLAEGEAAVIVPGGAGWTVVARIAVSDWQALSASP